MNQLISRPAHGAIDYAYAVLVPFLPEIARFSDQKKAAFICRTLGAGALTYTALTNAEWGVIKWLPFKAHLLVDLSVSLFAASSPWVFGFAANKKARNILLAVGAAGIAASLLTENENIS